MSFRVKIEGLSELKAALEELPKAVDKKVMRNVLRARAQPIADAARAFAPVGTGRLKNSITVSSRLSKRQSILNSRGETKSYVEIYIGPGPFPYAHLVEFGSVHNKPRPFMRPAWDVTKASLLNNIKDDLWTEIQKAADRLARKAAKAKAKG